MFWQMILKRKKIVIIILIIFGAGGYYYYNNQQAKKNSVSYTTSSVTKGTISVTVSGAGQVSDLNKVELKPLGSGELKDLRVKNGDLVKTDQVIAVLDQRSSERSLAQARASYSSAQASFSKVVAGSTTDEIKTAQNSFNQAELSYKNALTALDNTTKTSAQTLDQAQKTLDDLLLFSGTSSSNKRDAVLNTIEDKIAASRSALDAENKALNDENLRPTLGVRDSSALNIMKQSYAEANDATSSAQSSLNIAKSYKSDSNINSAVNSSINLLNKTLISSQYYFSVMQATITSSSLTQTQLDSYKSGASSQVSTMSSAITSIQTSLQSLKDAIVSAQNSLDSAKLSTSQQIYSAKAQVESTNLALQVAKDKLNEVKQPPSSQDIQIARAQLVSAQTQLQSAQDAYDNNIIKAPFEGQIADLAVQKGDQISSSSVIATLITKQKIAIIPFNETDVAKIKPGQLVTISFDALSDVTLTGKVGEVDLLGKASQGVVTYGVKIVFDTQSNEVKSGMSVNVSIIIDSRTDVLLVENSALKNDTNGSYIEALDNNQQPQRQYVQTGLANDTETEIVSGLNEGDKIITQTITNSSTTTSNTSTRSSGSSFRLPGLGGGGPRD